MLPETFVFLPFKRPPRGFRKMSRIPFDLYTSSYRNNRHFSMRQLVISCGRWFIEVSPGLPYAKPTQNHTPLRMQYKTIRRPISIRIDSLLSTRRIHYLLYVFKCMMSVIIFIYLFFSFFTINMFFGMDTTFAFTTDFREIDFHDACVTIICLLVRNL